MTVDTQKYLERIGLGKANATGLQLLKQLQRQHLLSVPFENLDIHWGREILLDPKRIFKKIVELQRGGFCYELNGLFCELLNQLGFDAYKASARMLRDDGTMTPDFEHMCVLVKLGAEVFLCDVGFGKGPSYPLRVLSNSIQIDLNEFFRITKHGQEGWWLEQSDDGSTFEKKYLFSGKKRKLIEFIDRCYYQQNSPDSHFKKQKMITQATADGRITLTEKLLIITSRGIKTEHTVLNEDDFYIKLGEHFNIRKPTDLA